MANNIHSNFVPGDFGPAAEKLGIQLANGYYDLGAMLDAAAGRIQELEELLDSQEAQLQDLTRAVGELSAKPAATVDTSERSIIWVNAAESFARGRDITLVFKTMPGATCRLRVRYLGTGGWSTSPAVRTPAVANDQGIVQWTWELTARARQDARVTLTATTPDGSVLTASWTFAVAE